MLIGIDADDTLWPGDPSGRMPQVMAEFMERVGDATLGQRHVLNTELFGAGALSLFWTMAESALQSDMEPGKAVNAMRDAAAFCRAMHEDPVEPYPGVADALAALKVAGHRLVLVTQGSPAEQMSKLHRSGLSGLFDGMALLAWKSESAYKSLIDEACGGDGSEFVMVGDSMQHDVAAPQAAGAGMVVLIDPDVIPSENSSYRVAESVADLPTLLVAPPPASASAQDANSEEPEASEQDGEPPTGGPATQDAEESQQPTAAPDQHPALMDPALNTGAAHEGEWHQFPDRGFGVRVKGAHAVRAVLKVDVKRKDGIVVPKLVSITEPHPEEGYSVGLVIGDNGKAAPIYGGR